MNKKDFTQDFPQLEQMKQDGLVYLDNAATSLKLKRAVEKQSNFDLFQTSNVHRGAHRLSSAATQSYENSRTQVAKHFNCNPEQIVFTKGTTDSLNLVAHSLGAQISSQDSILISEMEHHANILPWQRLAQKTGAQLLWASVDKNGELNLEEIKELFKTHKIKICSLCHSSNTIGTINPIEEIGQLCKTHDCLFSVDGAQSVAFKKIDLNQLDCDFFSFSAHKMFGPFGCGVAYIKNPDLYPPYQLGGGIINFVERETSSFLNGPVKFEAGTPNISGAIAFAEVFDFFESLDFEKVEKHERDLLNLALKELSQLEGFQEVGKSLSRTNVLSFNFDGVHPHDFCTLLDEQGVALRSGHHCSQPLLRKFSLEGCARASFAFYNTETDVEALVSASRKALEILR